MRFFVKQFLLTTASLGFTWGCGQELVLTEVKNERTAAATSQNVEVLDGTYVFQTRAMKRIILENQDLSSLTAVNLNNEETLEIENAKLTLANKDAQVANLIGTFTEGENEIEINAGDTIFSVAVIQKDFPIFSNAITSFISSEPEKGVEQEVKSNKIYFQGWVNPIFQTSSNKQDEGNQPQLKTGMFQIIH